MKQASFIVPTFKEKEKIQTLIHCFSNIKAGNIDIIIVNGNPNDSTSQWLKSNGDNRIIELSGNSSLYWSGLVNVGLRFILNAQEKPEYVFLLNADIQFSIDILQSFLNKAKTLSPCQLAAVTTANGKVLSSGVKVNSWFFTLTRHPLAGLLVDSLQKKQLIPVDYLPTRCVMFPFQALIKAGFTEEILLPHYGSDYEYTARLSRLGYRAFITTDIQIELDIQNTGADVYTKRINIWKRTSSIFSIKSPSNPIYKIRFVKLVYPKSARPTAMVLYFVRSLLEIFLGGSILKKIFSHSESGFSGR